MTPEVQALEDRVAVLEDTLKKALQRCGKCAAYATRTYFHVCGYAGCLACDNPECLMSYHCSTCGQVWYGDGAVCDGYKGDGTMDKCLGTTKELQPHAYDVTDLPYAEVVRSLK